MITTYSFWFFRVFFLLLAEVSVWLAVHDFQNFEIVLGGVNVFMAVLFGIVMYAYWGQSYGQFSGRTGLDPPNTPPRGLHWSRLVLMTIVAIGGGVVMLALVYEELILALTLFVVVLVGSWSVHRWIHSYMSNRSTNSAGKQHT